MGLYNNKLKSRKIVAYIADKSAVGVYAKPSTTAELETLKSNFERVGVLHEKGVELTLAKGQAVKDNAGVEHVLDYACTCILKSGNIDAAGIAAVEELEGVESYVLLEYNDGDIKIIKNVFLSLEEKDVSGEVGTLTITATKTVGKKTDFRDYFNTESFAS